jgi:aminoglycoside 6'-N-acetyltransferase
MEAFTFRRVGRADFPLLAGWLAEPHVARWWNHEFTAEAVERDFGPTVDGNEANEDHLVLADGRPIGLIQCWIYQDFPDYLDELSHLVVVPDQAVGIDYFIGDPDFVGRGVGRAMISRFTQQVWDTKPATTSIVVAVNSSNEASWKALLGAGFRRVARGDLEPDNPFDDPLHEIFRLDRPEP